MSNVNIALSANTAWYLYNFRYNLIVHLLNHNYNISVICPSDSKFSDKLKSLGCTHIPLNINRKISTQFMKFKPL